MSRKGECLDNAVAESFFGTLKNELIYHEDYKTKQEARQSIFEYIEVFYNWKRRHAPDFDTFFTKPLILLESKNKLGTTLKVSVDYLIR